MTYSNEPISTVEDLDPEPPPRNGGRSTRAWEVALGVALLALVLGFVGWQWLQQSRQQSDYSAGLDAMQRDDLEGAESYFASASGYLDADKQAQEVATRIARREGQYQIAVDSRNAGNWAACLKSIQQVVEIQPGYKDSAYIEEEAAGHVYSDALSGTIALRTAANPPGLYYYGASGWTLLPRSDDNSRIQGESPGGWLVYDVPPSPPSSSITPTPVPFSSPARRLMVVSMLDPSHARELAVDLAPYDFYLVTDHGIWDARRATSAAPAKIPILSGQVELAGEDIVYLGYTATLTTTIRLPDLPPGSDPRLRVLDFDPYADRYLLADSPFSDVLGSSDTLGGPTTLYLGDASGDLKSLYTVRSGGFKSAQFSPDGRHAVVETFAPAPPADEGTEREDILLLDLEGQNPQVTLATGLRQITRTGRTLTPNLFGFIFLSGGRLDGDLLVTEHISNPDSTIHSYRLRVFDLSSTNGLLIDTFMESSNPIQWTAQRGSPDLALISGEEIVPNDYPLVEVPLWFVTLSLDKPPAVTRLRTLINTHLQYARLVGDILAYSTYEIGQNNRDNRSVFSFPISRFGAIGENAWTMFTQMDTATGDDVFSYGDHGLGPTLLAYVAGGDLHARLYDGSVDVTLEHGVTYLYNTSLHRP